MHLKRCQNQKRSQIDYIPVCLATAPLNLEVWFGGSFFHPTGSLFCTQGSIHHFSSPLATGHWPVLIHAESQPAALLTLRFSNADCTWWQLFSSLKLKLIGLCSQILSILRRVKCSDKSSSFNIFTWTPLCIVSYWGKIVYQKISDIPLISFNSSIISTDLNNGSTLILWLIT